MRSGGWRMIEYHKIQTVFMRDPKTHKILPGEYSRPEFEMLQDIQWDLSEKIDGMNIRIDYHGDPWRSITYAGRTDRSVIPDELLRYLQADLGYYDLNRLPMEHVTLFGEGFGRKIQAGGDLYGDAQRFILFDVCVNGRWLSREDVKAVAQELGIPVVPASGGTLADMVVLCEHGLDSLIGDRPAEGIVARPAMELLDAHGDRIICKLKTKDFR